MCVPSHSGHVRLCNPRDCSVGLHSQDLDPPGSSVHGTVQARILEWVAMPSSRGSSDPGSSLHPLRLLHQQTSSSLLAPPGAPPPGLCFQAKSPLSGFHRNISLAHSWKGDMSEQVSRWPGPAHLESRVGGAQQVEHMGMGRAGECPPTHLAPTGTRRHLLWDFRETVGRIWGWVRTEHHGPSLARCAHPARGQARQVRP